MIQSRIEQLLILVSSVSSAVAFSVLSPLPPPPPSSSSSFLDATSRPFEDGGSCIHNSRTPWLIRHHRRLPSSIEAVASTTRQLEEPDPADSDFGRMAYWDESYAQPEPAAESKSSSSEDHDGSVSDNVQVFSWYCGWTEELGPFFEELVPDKDSMVLVPGIGNDAAIRDMFDHGGYHRLMAFDYAPQGVECAKAMFGTERLQTITDSVYGSESESTKKGDVFKVCDARDLSGDYESNFFDAVLDKGTFDSIYLSGGKDKVKARENLTMAINEMKRVVREDGIVFSVTAACVDAVREAFDSDRDWEQLRDGSMHITENGYASNNVDATMLAWQLRTLDDTKAKADTTTDK
eukprot:jgi/Psemu1/263924/estExt_Genewise1Plus.C_12720010